MMEATPKQEKKRTGKSDVLNRWYTEFKVITFISFTGLRDNIGQTTLI